MGILKRLFLGSTVVTFGGYYFLHEQLKKQFQDIPVYQLPKNSKIGKTLDKQYELFNNEKTYIAYIDTFKKSVKLPNLESINDSKLLYLLTEKVLNVPIISNQLNDQSKITKAQIIDQTYDKNSRSTIVKWDWRSSKVINWYETLSNYGFPWRLMNGGYNEIFVLKTSPTTIDIYFATAHEYNNLRDGKLVPSWIQSLQRDYSRLILYLSTKDL